MERKRQPEFSRTEMLIGHEGMEILARSTIVVFGVAEWVPTRWKPWPGAVWDA